MVYMYLLYRKVKNKIQNYIYNKIAICQLKQSKAFFSNDIKFVGPTFLMLQGKISIGRGFICKSSVTNCIESGCSKIVVKEGAILNVGNFSGMSNVSLHCYNNINIGDFVNIGAGTMIIDTNFHSTKWQDRGNRVIDSQNARTASINIGDYVFIGARCIVGKGVTIGDKSMISAGSTVVKDVPPGELWGGNPARFIKKLDI